MSKNILLILSIMLAIPVLAGCAAPEKKETVVPPPLIEHRNFKASLSVVERKDIAGLVKQLNDPKTVFLRDPGNPRSFQSPVIDGLVEYGRKAIPALQKEYIKLSKLEAGLVAKLSDPNMVGAARDKLMEKRYALRTRKYAVMQPLFRINHQWNVHFFAVELCSHYNPTQEDYSSDESKRGDIAVRQTAAEYLYKFGNEKFLCNLIWALLDEDHGVVRTAATALRKISGQDFGLIDARTDEEIANSVNTWWDWYRGYLERKSK